MELNIDNHGSKKDLTVDRQRERHDGKRSDKTSKKPIQESMMINTTPVKISTREKKKGNKRGRTNLGKWDASIHLEGIRGEEVSFS